MLDLSPLPTSMQVAYAAQWDHPTALDFETSTMEALRFRAHVDLGREMMPTPPRMLVDMIGNLWDETRRALVEAEQVVDAGDPQGIAVDHDLQRDRVLFVVDQKTWPAIEGVTVPRTDGDSTL